MLAASEVSSAIGKSNRSTVRDRCGLALLAEESLAMVRRSAVIVVVVVVLLSYSGGGNDGVCHPLYIVFLNYDQRSVPWVSPRGCMRVRGGVP
jgi:hypothetical protein